MSDVLGVGVVGCGYWGPNLVRNFMETPASRVVAVCDLRPDASNSLVRRYPTIETTSDYRGSLARSAHRRGRRSRRPVSTHFDLAMRALEAGKHVLVEKPLSRIRRDADALVDEAERRNLVLMVDHTFVYTGAVQTDSRAGRRSGALGDIYYYDSVRVNLGLFQHDVNVHLGSGGARSIDHGLCAADASRRQSPRPESAILPASRKTSPT